MIMKTIQQIVLAVGAVLASLEAYAHQPSYLLEITVDSFDQKQIKGHTSSGRKLMIPRTSVSKNADIREGAKLQVMDPPLRARKMKTDRARN